MADYTIGTGDPTIKPDPGAGAWAAKKPSIEVMAQYQALTSALGTNPIGFIHPIFGGGQAVSRGTIMIAIGDDAVSHLDHYLRDTGTDYTIDLDGMVEEVSSAKTLFEAEVALAKQFVETLPPGTHTIASRKATNGYNYQHQSKNWYFAVGGYSIWGKGKATVTQASGGRAYHLDFEYKFFDRYNWDNGKSVTIPYINLKITDHFMGEFHRCGLAKEFNMNGSMKKAFDWGAPTSAKAAPQAGSPR